MTTSPPVFKAQDPSDLINVLPTAFGFVPQESICLLATYGPRHRAGFRLRLDLDERLPPQEAARIFHHHLKRQHADGAMIVAISERPNVAERYVREIEAGLGDVTLVVSVWATDDRYWTTSEFCDPGGYPYERSLHHVAVVQAMAEGQEILESRDALRARIAPVEGPRRRWLAAAFKEHRDEVSGLLMNGGDEHIVDVARRDVGPLVERVCDGEDLTDGEILRLAVWTIPIPVRDDLIGQIDRENAHVMNSLWQRAARLAPPGLRSRTLCLAGMAAYQCGDGAQAAIAAEEAVRADPDYSLAQLLWDITQSGIKPEEVAAVWQRHRRTAR